MVPRTLFKTVRSGNSITGNVVFDVIVEIFNFRRGEFVQEVTGLH